MKSTILNGWSPTLLATLAFAPYVWFILVLFAAVQTGRTLGESAAHWIYFFPLFLPLAFGGVCFWNRRKEFTLASIAISFALALVGAPIAWGCVVLYIVARRDMELHEAAAHWAIPETDRPRCSISEKRPVP